MQKTVFFVTSHRAPELGGGERWNIKIAEALAADGYTIGLITTPEATIAKEFERFSRLIYTFPFKFDFNPFSIRKMQRIFSEHQVQVVICNFNKDVSIAGIAARRAGVQNILFRNGFPILHEKFKHKLLLPYFDTIITNSQAIVDQYSAYKYNLHERIQLIYNGMPVAEKRPILAEKLNPTGAIRILGCGRFTSVKRFDRFIHLVHYLQQAKFDVKATLIGSGPELSALKELNRKLGTKIKFTGYVNTMQPYYENSDLLLHTSENEGLPNVVMEAMYYGSLAAVFHSGGIDDLITNGENGFILNDPAENDLKQIVQDLLSSPERFQALLKNAQNTIYERFQFSHSYTKVKALIDS